MPTRALCSPCIQWPASHILYSHRPTSKHRHKKTHLRGGLLLTLTCPVCTHTNADPIKASNLSPSLQTPHGPSRYNLNPLALRPYFVPPMPLQPQPTKSHTPRSLAHLFVQVRQQGTFHLAHRQAHHHEQTPSDPAAAGQTTGHSGPQPNHISVPPAAASHH